MLLILGYTQMNHCSIIRPIIIQIGSLFTLLLARFARSTAIKLIVVGEKLTVAQICLPNLFVKII